MTFHAKKSVLVVIINNSPTNVCLQCMHLINHAYNLGVFASEVDD